jgi:uncharacterized protein YdaU (DUF1376 family)
MSGPGFPWLKWFPRDFASSTRGWPLVARGVYRELLDAAWDIGGPLPDDQERLRALAGASPAEWRIAWRYVETKFPVGEGGRVNPRLEEHRVAALREYNARRKGAETVNAKLGRRSTLSDTLSDSDSERSATRSPIRKALRVASSSSSSTRSGVQSKRLAKEAGEPQSPPDDPPALAANGVQR